MLVDSHCHLDFPELIKDLPGILERMQEHHIERALCISVNLEAIENVLALAGKYPQLYASVGVHPDYQNVEEPSVERLADLAARPKVIAIGETGLDYFRLTGDLEWQRERFRTHIRAARQVKKPLIVHTREAREDTLRILREEGAEAVGGVLHCFTETLDMAKAAIDLGFYISFSGILTFKKAEELKQTAKALPLNRILIETDSPYLAPIPFRGKTNEPSFVRHVAQTLADIRQQSFETIARATTENFYRLFGLTP